MCGHDPDKQFMVPMFVDSKSAIAMMNHEKINKQNRHITRRIHIVRHAKATGVVMPLKIDGELNPADVGTKNLDATIFKRDKSVIHIKIQP